MRKARKFFDEFAKSKNFNPLDSERWYAVTKKEILRAVSFLIILIISFVSDEYLRGERNNSYIMMVLTQKHWRDSILNSH